MRTVIDNAYIAYRSMRRRLQGTLWPPELDPLCAILVNNIWLNGSSIGIASLRIRLAIPASTLSTALRRLGRRRPHPALSEPDRRSLRRGRPHEGWRRDRARIGGPHHRGGGRRPRVGRRTSHVAALLVLPGCSRRWTKTSATDLPTTPGRNPAASLEAAHRGLFGRVGVVPAADVERAVDHEEPQLVGRRPADVAGLAAAAGLGLLDRPLDRDDDVAEMRSAAGRQREAGRPRPRLTHRPGWAGNASGGSSGNDRTSVGPVLPRCAALSAASSASSDRISPIEAGDGAPPASSAAATARARARPGDRGGDAVRTVRSTRHGPR